MVIIKAELLLENEKIQNEMSLLLEQFSPSSGILMDILKFQHKREITFWFPIFCLFNITKIQPFRITNELPKVSL